MESVMFEILVRHPSGKSNRHVNIQVEQRGVDMNVGSHWHAGGMSWGLDEIICDHSSLKIKPYNTWQ